MDTPRDTKLRTLLKYCGLRIGGDVGPFTVYTTRRGRRVIYPIAPPTAPATPKQRRQRSRFALAVQRFTALSAADKREWARIVRVLSVRHTGQSLFVGLSLVPQEAAWPALVAVTGTYLLHPEVIET